MDESYDSILPPELAAGLRRLPEAERAAMQELRLRCGQAAAYLAHGREHAIPCGLHGCVVDRAMLQALVNRATGYCAYAAAAQLRQGFLTLPGGHRLGLCGQAVPGPDGVRTLRDFTSANLRIARQRPGAMREASAFVHSHPASTLVAGPPGCGKTTLLRELVVSRSDEAGERVGIVDERMELAANGSFRVGRQTDVLSGISKHEGIYMLLRTMNPDWICVDEITDERDLDALVRSSFCGVRILASAHIFTRADLQARPLYARMCSLGLFENLIVMDKQHGMTMERMIANDKAAGSSPDRSLRGLCRPSDGA